MRIISQICICIRNKKWTLPEAQALGPRTQQDTRVLQPWPGNTWHNLPRVTAKQRPKPNMDGFMIRCHEYTKLTNANTHTHNHVYVCMYLSIYVSMLCYVMLCYVCMYVMYVMYVMLCYVMYVVLCYVMYACMHAYCYTFILVFTSHKLRVTSDWNLCDEPSIGRPTVEQTLGRTVQSVQCKAMADPILFISIYTYLYISGHIHTYLYISIHIYTYLDISIHIYTHLYISVHIYTYRYISIQYRHISIHIYIYIHI